MCSGSRRNLLVASLEGLKFREKNLSESPLLYLPKEQLYKYVDLAGRCKDSSDLRLCAATLELR